MTRFILSALLFLTGCAIERIGFGADELIIDSYKIREGDDWDEEPAASSSVLGVMVMGNEAQTRLIPLKEGFLPLKQVLAEVGAAPKRVEIIRGASENPKIYTIRLEHILELPNDSLLVIPGDTVSLH